MAGPATFDVEGCLFEVRRLNVDDTCEGLELLTRALGPAFAAAAGGVEGEEANWLIAALGQASLIPKLLRLFAPVTKVSRQPDGTFAVGGAMVDLKPFVNDVFGGEHVRMIAFIGKAVQNEYGNFFANAGSLQALLAPAPTTRL